MELQGKNVLVVGLGASGLAAAKLLVARGATVTVNDKRERDAIGERADAAEAAGAALVFGGHPEALFVGSDVVVVSPGVPPLPAMTAAERAGVTVASEVELASWFVDSTVVAITGTNGKSTVTTLIGEMCARTGRATFVGGNLGRPLVEVVGDPAATGDGFVVVELSSFQLERVGSFRANVAVLLNVSEDHLDRYESYADYVAAKARIFHGQRAADHAVVPAGDEVCRSIAGAGAARVHGYGAGGEVRVEDGAIVGAASGLSVATDALRIRGGHNVDNACAAALSARLAGVPVADIDAVLRSFAGLPHRMEHVRDLDGVVYFNDSKATNVGAAAAAIDGLFDLDGKVVLVAGGRDKGGSYGPLRDRMDERGRAIVLIGEAAERLADAFGGSAVTVARAETLEAAVGLARGLAQPGDAVVLAPACSSYDMFRSYVVRGDAFESAVLALEEAR